MRLVIVAENDCPIWTLGNIDGREHTFIAREGERWICFFERSFIVGRDARQLTNAISPDAIN
jgi:hypothetical protein